MDIKELEDIVNQLSSDVTKNNTDFKSFRSEAKRNDDNLFNISRELYTTLRCNKDSISSIQEGIQDIKENNLLVKKIGRAHV